MQFTYYAEVYDASLKKAISTREPLHVDVSGNPPVVRVGEMLELRVTEKSTLAQIRIYLSQNHSAAILTQHVGSVEINQVITLKKGPLA